MHPRLTSLAAASRSALARALDRLQPHARRLVRFLRLKALIRVVRRRKRLSVAAVAAFAALTVTVVLAFSGSDQSLLARTATAPEVEAQPAPVLAAEEILTATGVEGEFSFVLYDSVEDRYLLSYRADETHNTMSTAKLFIAIGALELGADPADIAKMISMSDDPIANSLWGVVGGPDLITELAGTMGLEHTTPSPEYGRWGDVQISASDMARVVEYVMTELPEDDRTVIVDAMEATTEHGSDGYDQTFGIPTAAAGRDWAVKQGWGCCKPDRFLVSAGTVGADHRYIAAVFGAFDETVSTEEQSAAEMTLVTTAVLRHLPE
ncbi:hypothetical protein [Glycomyces sp. NPDC048151]|uniref:hypothetical protein n=1 Tax=Glycomyces sp. NPDC048151 TaxID=3364002 RepID=UPI0037136BD3